MTHSFLFLPSYHHQNPIITQSLHFKNYLFFRIYLFTSFSFPPLLLLLLIILLLSVVSFFIFNFIFPSYFFSFLSFLLRRGGGGKGKKKEKKTPIKFDLILSF
ncbi:hypothetical protein, unlikely [Trypanosoma brucei brucei TREU927]|uniref:Uncharacterized protein n=1 Tax=Trypanosoma brucei brucei (strain 927/4 GUTat10.1) TaxID=185431 RepID=Q4GYW0_TRYB2|nr:hypothetical protein, unlikely [Trypanosoma brucei brucei TREU927]CAJ16409.1 hypothetical protein, unlikely [Trypanosoma brucei brucei TREU927]